MDPVPDCPTCGGNSAVTATTTGDTTTYRCAATYAHDDHQPRFWTVARTPARTAAARATGTRAPARSTGPPARRAAPPRGPRSPPPPPPNSPHRCSRCCRPSRTCGSSTACSSSGCGSTHPDLFGRHVADAGHVLLRAGAVSGTTASGLRVATALLRLEREAAVTHFNAAPTGVAWAQDRLVGYWAVRPKPPREDVLTWQDFAVTTLGRGTATGPTTTGPRSPGSPPPRAADARTLRDGCTNPSDG